METGKHRDMRNLETWKHGMEIWKDRDMEKDRDLETWINGDMGMETWTRRH